MTAKKSASSASRRERLRLEQERAAREKRIRTWVSVGVIAIVLLAAIGLVTYVATRSAGTADPTSRAATTPSGGAVDGDTLVVGAADAPVTIDIYQDYLCPYCGQFERAGRADLEGLVADGTARVRLHPLTFLDPQSAGSNYSTRAANAAVIVAEQEPDRLLAFNAALFDQQPAEGTQGLTDDQVADLARGAGVTEATVALFATQDFSAYLKDLNDAAFADEGITGTPTVKINGQVFDGDLYAAGPLKAAVQAAAAGR